MCGRLPLCAQIASKHASIGCGVITIVIRYFGAYNEGVSFAILLMNAFVWMIDMAAKPRRYGLRRFARLREKFGAKHAGEREAQK